MVRTFYLTNAEPKDVESMLKAVLGARNMYIDERAGAVILRDSPDEIRMAEKLVASLDVPEPEVMLEVEVLEISSNGCAIWASSTRAQRPCCDGARDWGNLGSRAVRSGPSELQYDHHHAPERHVERHEAADDEHVGKSTHPGTQQGEGEDPHRQPLPVITNSVTPTAAASGGDGQRAIPGCRPDPGGATDRASR